MESLVWLLGGLKNPKNGTLKMPACHYFQSYKRRLVAQFCYFWIFSSFFIMNQSWVISSQGKYMISGWTYLQLDSKRPQNSQKVDLDHVSENAQIWQFLLFYGSNWRSIECEIKWRGPVPSLCATMIRLVSQKIHMLKSPSNKTGNKRQRAGTGDICLYGVIPSN